MKFCFSSIFLFKLIEKKKRKKEKKRKEMLDLMNNKNVFLSFNQEQIEFNEFVYRMLNIKCRRYLKYR